MSDIIMTLTEDHTVYVKKEKQDALAGVLINEVMTWPNSRFTHYA